MEDYLDLSLLSNAFQSNWTDDYLENLDTSEYPFPNTLWYRKPGPEVAWKCCMMLFIGISGIYMNSVILLITVKNKWLWTPSNYLVGNMAFIDLLSLLICPWLWLTRHFYQSYVLGGFGCLFEGFLQATFLVAGVGAVMLVSYDRMAAAALPPDARVTKAAAPKLIVASWCISAGLSLPWVIKRQYFERQWLDFLEAYCVEDVQFLNMYWHIIVTVLVWIPLGGMVITYGSIMWRLEKSARKLNSHGSGNFVSRARGRAMRITALVLIVAALCRLPYTVMIYWRNNLELTINAVDEGYGKIWFAANFLIYFNSAVNPLIYGFTNERFRRAMDRTPGVACCKFGSWCCACSMLNKKTVQIEDKNTEKIFVIESTPRPNKKIGYLIRNILHIHKETLEFSSPKVEEVTNKPTKITPLKTVENV